MLADGERGAEDRLDAQTAGQAVPPTAARAAEAMQPQRAQSGVPPNWHGVMRFSRSAETHSVVCAKMHSTGDAGGFGHTSSIPLGICSFGWRSRSAAQLPTTWARSAAVRRSADSSSTCGV